MARYKLSPEAQKSLIDIKAYSVKNFGKKRAITYLQKIRTRMLELASNPNRGALREDLKIGFYSEFIGSHTIYYRIKDNDIEIIHVLHQAMEPSKHICR